MRAMIALLSLSLASAGNSAVVTAPGAGGYSYRVQALSPTLVRVERSEHPAPNSSGALFALPALPALFEDRPTFLAANRSWGAGVAVHTSGGGGDKSNVTVSTAGYAVRFEFAKPATPAPQTSLSSSGGGGGGGGDSCNVQQPGRDAVCAGKCEAFRTAAYPHGRAGTASAAVCCALCNSDAECRYWVWESAGARVCYPLTAAIGSTPTGAGRVFGGSEAPPPPPPPPPGQAGNLSILDVASGAVLWHGRLDLSGVPAQPRLPDPGAVPPVWPLRDAPRFVPPAWGATPPPAPATRLPAAPAPAARPPLDPALANTSGFDFRASRTPDAYFFLPGAGGAGGGAGGAGGTGGAGADSSSSSSSSSGSSSGSSNGTATCAGAATATAYETLRRDLLSLTGAIPLLPDYAYGVWFTWYAARSIATLTHAFS